MGKVSVSIWAVSGGVGPIGGYVDVFKNPGGVPLYRGRITAGGVTRDLEPLSWTGLGVSFKRIAAEIEVECTQPGALEYSSGDKIELVGVTLFMLSGVRVTFKLHCNPGGDYHEDSDTDMDVGIGLEGYVSTWRVV